MDGGRRCKVWMRKLDSRDEVRKSWCSLCVRCIFVCYRRRTFMGLWNEIIEVPKRPIYIYAQ